MTTIPKPPKKKAIAPDPSQLFLNKWKELFNEIDPGKITATIKGEKDFPKDFGFSESRLSDSYDVDVQLYVSLPGEFFHKINGDICCCLGGTAFCTGWIHELDENLDTMIEDPIQWKAMHERLVEIVIRYRKRIPNPSEVVAKDES